MCVVALPAIDLPAVKWDVVVCDVAMCDAVVATSVRRQAAGLCVAMTLDAGFMPAPAPAP